jgi:cytochrome c oxidase cbb3-type subunit III
MKNLMLKHLPKVQIQAPKYLLAGFAMISGISLYAQGNVPENNVSNSVFLNPLFLALSIIIILLIIVIIVLGNVLTGVAEAAKDVSKKGKEILTITILISLMIASKDSVSQVSDVSENVLVPSLNSGLLYLMLSIIGFELLIIIVLLNLIQLFIKKKERVVVKEIKPSFLEKLNASVAIEKEEAILFDHVYDGIRELDNDLPPWWKYGFYLTIVFAFVYMIHFHIAKTGDLQIAEYDRSQIVAQEKKDEFAKNNASNVNETNAEMLTDVAEIAKGAEIFKGSCFACHGKFGEGGVGPNLTDDYWLHGGSIKNIFASIKYGWPDKGMKSWQSDFSPIQIHQIASFIKTLHGTKPANAKDKQGDLYTEAGSVKDSMSTTNLKVDSIVVGK